MKTFRKSLAIFLTVLMIFSSVPFTTGLTSFAKEDDEVIFMPEKAEATPEAPEGWHLTGRTNVDENGETIWHIEENEASEFGLINELWINIFGQEVQNPDYPLAYPETDENSEPIDWGENLPESYDSRDLGIITPVEYQVGGTCWAHAGVACIETAYLKNYGVALDLSEYHLAWFAKNSYYPDVTDSANDGTTAADIVANVLDAGGNMSDVSTAMNSFSGGVLESRYPLNTEDDNNRVGTEQLAQDMIDTFTYDTRYEHDVVLESVKSISYNIDTLKQAVVDYGAVKVSYYSDDAYYNYKDGYGGWYVGQYGREDYPVAFYHPDANGTNHAVTLVGWDDNFSRENFGTYKPQNNGAWLIKNSWSTRWGNNGYFWISYEDTGIQKYASNVVEIGDVAEYEDVYLHDGLGNKSYRSYKYSNGTVVPVTSANVFTAENDIYLSKVSYGSSINSDYTLSIYKNLAENCTDPTQGTLVYTQSGKTNNEKYININGDAKIAEGEKFSVVIEMDRFYYEGIANNKTCDSGDSFYCDLNTNEWVDTSTQSDLGNICIRAIAKIQNDSGSYKVTYRDGTKYSETAITENGTVTLPEKSGHTYILTYNGQPFTGTNITQDITVNMHCYPTSGEISEENPCTVEYKCIYCGEKVKDDYTSHNTTSVVIPATPTSIGYTESTCSTCGLSEKTNKVIHEDAVGGLVNGQFWWQYMDGNLYICPDGDTVRLPDYTSSSAVPWASYLNTITCVYVDDGVTYLGDYMFSGLPAMSTLVLTDDITEIGDYCFSGAQALNAFDCPEKLTKIGTYAFNGAISLTEINYNDTIKTIRDYAFCGCTSLETGIIPGSATAVGEFLYDGCSKLKKIVVEEGVTYVSYLAWNTPKLEEIVFPSTLTLTYFMNYAYLQKYTISPDNKKYCSVDGVAYSKDMTVLYGYPASKTDLYYKVPASVTKIYNYSFSYIKNLKYLDLSDCAVTTIMDKVFNQVQASYLSINLPKTLTQINSNAFYKTRIQKLYVPSTVTTLQNPPFTTNGDSYYMIPGFYTDSEDSAIKAWADENGYNCTVLHTEHNYSTNVSALTKNPTCKDEGSSMKTCVCGNFEYKTLPATGEHTPTNSGTVTAPTCTDNGFTTYTCKSCGISYTANETAATGHTAGTVVKENEVAPTCSADGSYDNAIYCTVCGAETSRETITVPATGDHVYATETEKVEATCTVDGYVIKACACGATEKTTLTAKGHTNETIPAVAPSCTATGLTEGTKCSVCGEILTAQETVAATGHTAGTAVKENEVSPSCTVDGSYDNVTYCTICGAETSRETITVAANGHDYKSAVTAPTCTDKGYTTYKCASCGDTYTGNEVNATGHSYNDGIITTKPDCTTAGVKTFTCTTCGHSYTEAVAANGHTAGTIVKENEVSPSCTADGSYDNATYCTVCGAEISRETITVPATGDHVYATETEKVEATCTVDGYVIKACACGATEKTTLTAKGHTNETIPAVAPSCTATGLTEGTKCSVCGEILTAQETVAATGHTAGTAVKENEVSPSCTADGSYDNATYCTVCGAETSRETITVAANGHDYKSAVTTPTCTDKGYTTYTCTSCGDSYTADEVAAKGHNYTSAVTAPTCTAKGYTTYTCTSCGDSYTADEVAAKGHEYTSVVTAPTCTAKGYTTYTCTSCGHSYKADEVAAKGHSFGDWAVTKAPTCSAKGVESRSCTACDKTETRSVATIAHSYESTVVEPTCTKDGYTANTCTVCGNSTKTDTVKSTGHSDSDADHTCDICGASINPSAGCSCNCHKNGFMGFIWKIIRFFQKLFGTNKICSCGVAHY